MNDPTNYGIQEYPQRKILQDLKTIIWALPHGYSEVRYQGRRYGLSRQDYANGKSIKVFARELGGTDFISFNCYLTAQGKVHLKPCEMPEPKIIHFLEHHKSLE